MINFRTTLMLTTGLAASLASAPALGAQTQPQAQPVTDGQAGAAAPAPASSEEEIIITAQKRAQTTIEVPQSVSVVSGATLEAQHADNFSDYLKLVPGLQLNQSTPGAGRLVLRGVNTGGVASTVGIYMDETPFGSSSGLVNAAVLAGDFDTFDLDRIEVLRGPQGTFYGASSLSGVLKFVTRLPSTTELVVRGRAGIETTKGGEAGYLANLAVNVPLGETLAIRASGTYRKYGGFIDSIGSGGSDFDKNINDTVSYGGRASLLFKPSAGISLRLTALAQDIKADAPSIIEADPATLERFYGRLSQSQFLPQFTDVKYRVYNATGTFDLGIGELTSSTSYNTQKQSSLGDFTFALSPLIAFFFGAPNELYLGQHTDSKKFTQEVRLAGESRLFDWLVGAYYTNEKGVILQEFVAVDPGTLNRIAGLPVLADVSLDSKYEEIAGFANITLHLGDRVDIDFGGRYSHNKQSAHQVSDGALAGGFNDFPVARSKENVFTYSVAPRFEVSDNVSLYARVAKGFRPGGPNVLPPGAPPGTPTTYGSDSVISYEVGVKAQSPDRRLSFEAALFHIDWTDIQLFAVVNGFGVNTNGSKAKSDGFEFTATARPLTGLNLSLNGAYTNARLTDDAPPEVGGLDGDRLPFTPRFSFGLNADYNWALNSNIDAHVGASLRHLSRQKSNFDPDFADRQRTIKAYGIFDLAAGLDFGRFSVDAYVKNLGNSAGRTSVTGTSVFGGFPLYPNGAIGTGVIRPRTIGLSLTAGL
ncbi:TonB-dependent receptor [Sphingomonas sp.]|uniref:TonB-dependent receptor n=1 Tax=Sphingomonas sp. TaxID=28214 RepID=UPI00286B9351|nr:TonB-dependent receptor [Sphingomonas sp.]